MTQYLFLLDTQVLHGIVIPNSYADCYTAFNEIKHLIVVYAEMVKHMDTRLSNLI